MKLGKIMGALVLTICLIVGCFAVGVSADDAGVEVKYQRLILNDALTMRFDIAADSDEAIVNVKVAGVSVLENQKISQLPAGEEGCYQLNVDLAAAQLTDAITLELVDGESVTTKTYSATGYANAVLGSNFKAETKNLVKAMLHYGAAAQTYFGYNTENLANAGLEAQEVTLPQPAINAMVSGNVDGIRYCGATLVFESRVAVRLYFEANTLEGIDFGGYQPAEKDGKYYVEIPNINPQNYDKEISVTVSGGGNALTINYSPLVYILRKNASTNDQALKALTAAMYQYHCAAKAYANVGEGVVTDDNGIVMEQVVLSGENSSAVVPVGTQLDENVSTLVLSATPLAETGSDVVVGENEKMISLDVHIAGISKDNTVPVLVTLDELAPEFLNQGNIALYHVENGVTVAMTRVYSISELDAHNEYYYDIATGTVTVAMASFSEVVAVADQENLWNGNVDTSWYNEAGKAFEIFNADQLAGLGELVDKGNTFDNKTITMLADINLKGIRDDGERRSFDPIGYGYEFNEGQVFKGTFDGNGNTIYNLYQNGWDLGYSYSMAGGGLFASIVDAKILNLTMDGADIVMECIDMGIVVGYANGTCSFENIIVRNSQIQNYNRCTGGVIGEIGGGGSYDLINVDVEATTTISALWGTFDPPMGGIIGGKWGEAGSRAGKGTDVVVKMTNCDVACVLDAYNDVTSAYQWYAYRRCGMLIGDTEESKTENGRTEATASWLTTVDCTVSYGDWVNYSYCQFTNVENSGRNYPWVRVEAGLSNPAYSNPRYGHPNDVNGVPVVDQNHRHGANDMCSVPLIFNQLYGGGQGCYGGNEHVEMDMGVSVINAPEKTKKFEAKFRDGFKIKTGTTVMLSDLFTAIDGQNIQSAYVYAFVSPLTVNDTVRATFNDNSKDWMLRTLTFSGTGNAVITIQDYYYCETTTFQICIPEPGHYIIVDHQILGTWKDDRENLGNRTLGAQLTYDLNDETYWNPEATNNAEEAKYYFSGEGVLYTLDKARDVSQIQLTFDGHAYYFDLYTSTDGVKYNLVETVTAKNYEQIYDEFVATFQGTFTNVKYIKILFTGSARNAAGNLNVWVTMREISLTVADPTVAEDPREVVTAPVSSHEFVGEWKNKYEDSASLGAPNSYDGIVDGDKFWQGEVYNYNSGAGIVYKLDGAYDLKSITLTQHMRPYYFDLYVSTDGENYMLLTMLDADNYTLFYDGNICYLENLTNVNIRYIKLIFTGNTAGSLWTSLNEIQIKGVKLETPENP